MAMVIPAAATRFPCFALLGFDNILSPIIKLMEPCKARAAPHPNPLPVNNGARGQDWPPDGESP